MTKKVMRFVDTQYGIMQCRVCGDCHFAARSSLGRRLVRDCWQCKHGCQIRTPRKRK